MQQFPEDLCLKHLGQVKLRYLKMWIAEILEIEGFIWTWTKTVYFYFLQQHMPNASKQACRKSVKPAACWPYAMHMSANTLFHLAFSTVPNSLVVSGDSTSSAGFSSGTSGLGYLKPTMSFQKQDSNQSLFKIFQSILEHPPARKDPL